MWRSQFGQSVNTAQAAKTISHRPWSTFKTYNASNLQRSIQFLSILMYHPNNQLQLDTSFQKVWCYIVMTRYIVSLHRIVSNIAILKAYRIISNIAIIQSQTIRYFALLTKARCPSSRYRHHQQKKCDGQRVISVTLIFQSRWMHSTEAAGRTDCQ